MHLKCVVDQDGNILGNLGFFEGDVHDSSDVNQSTVELSDTAIPRDFDKDCYKVVGGALKKKSSTEIKSIQDSRIAARKKPHIDELMALDADAQSEPLKTIIKYLQG